MQNPSNYRYQIVRKIMLFLTEQFTINQKDIYIYKFNTIIYYSLYFRHYYQDLSLCYWGRRITLYDFRQ